MITRVTGTQYAESIWREVGQGVDGFGYGSVMGWGCSGGGSGALTRPAPTRYLSSERVQPVIRALKGQNIPAQGNALGTGNVEN